LETLLEDFGDSPQYVLDDPRIEEDVEVTSELLDDTTALLARVNRRLAEAQDQVRLAAELRAEGNALVAQARNAVNRNAVLEARELWAEAREAYFNSLEIQQDPAFRDQADQIIATLGTQIQEAENRIVVARVRELINQAQNQYDAEQYLQARQTLLEARETWSRTNVTENPEIVRLLGFVSAALTLAGKRNLEETEPLYPVLSNYLNLAREDFNQARTARGAAGEDGRQVLIARADENLDNVLAVRPQNWEARVLKLRLLQLQDAENFNQAFGSRVQAALNQRNENPEEALTSLETLREINPDYPGLEQAIVDLEIRLGIRPDPVTQQQIARSNQLLAQARGLAGGGEAQNIAAIDLLEDAVQINPDNREAQLLLDRLRINTGGEATVALSSTDEQRFRRAETLFIQGNLGQALAIVQSLLQNPNNQQYPPLLDLRDRITARLGI
jgi:tetratricopeptide (TPR) repeat protein